MVGSGMNMITTVIGFGMSATFIVFVCIRLSCGRFRAAHSRRMFEIESRIDLEQPGHQTRGLQPDIVAAIPTLKFNRHAFSSSDDAQCTICLGEYKEKDVLRIMPKCGHSFHLACIDVWLRIQTTCPVCRLPLNSAIDRMPNRPAEFGAYPSGANNPEISVEHSQQMLLRTDLQSERDTNLENFEVLQDTNLENTEVIREVVQFDRREETR